MGRGGHADLYGDHLRGRLSRYRDPAASPDRSARSRATRASSRAPSPPLMTARPVQVAQAATRYVRAQPFSASSTLLFAIVPGAGTSTNRPELFDHAPPTMARVPPFKRKENRLSQQLVSAHDGYSTLRLPDVGDLRLLKRTVSIPASTDWRSAASRARCHWRASGDVGVGEPLLTVAHAQRGVARAFILAGFLTLAGALLAALPDRHARVASVAPHGRRGRPGGCRGPAPAYPRPGRPGGRGAECWRTRSTTCSTG